jgi:hypothetical protein
MDHLALEALAQRRQEFEVQKAVVQTKRDET